MTDEQFNKLMNELSAIKLVIVYTSIILLLGLLFIVIALYRAGGTR